MFNAIPNDQLSWLLRLPVVMIWIDQEQNILRLRLSNVSEAMLLLETHASKQEGGER